MLWVILDVRYAGSFSVAAVRLDIAAVSAPRGSDLAQTFGYPDQSNALANIGQARQNSATTGFCRRTALP